MTDRIEFFAPGVPAPGGSKRAIARVGKDGRAHASVVDDGKNNKGWRAVVALAASRAMDGRGPLEGPLELRMRFYVARPRGHFGTGRNARTVRASAPPWPTVKPDVTKLVRAAEDALKGIVWADDSQVVMQTATKGYSGVPGVRVVVRRMDGGADAPGGAGGAG